MVEGTQVGAYRVIHRIGAGGMGEVWLAEHTMLGRRAAVKVLHAQFSMQPEIVTRFFNEARAATAISDPGIVQIFDFGQHVDGSAYIVMELLEGESLDRRVSRTGGMAVADALRVMRQVATSLGAAHARGIVHRDLKPDNIFLVRDPEVAGGERAKILDFGIAKLTGDRSLKTSTQAVMGTPTYMSPEQCRGAGGVDQRSDIYSLGCVLFALLAGRAPFLAEGAGELIAMHLREQPPQIGAFRAGIPPEVEHLVARCLAKDPAHRYTDANELAHAIGALGFSSAPTAPTRLATDAQRAVGSATPTTLSSASGVVAGAPRRSRALPFALGGLIVAGAAVAIIVVVTRDGGSKGSSPSAPAVAQTPPPPSIKALAEPPSIKGPASAPKPPAAPKAEELVGGRMKAVLDGFVAWAKDHAGAACPDVAALGVDTSDPWHHAMKLSCTDQPGDQIVGLVSAGPDGQFGTADDIASWQLAHDVTAAVHGSRWVAAAPKPTKPAKPAIATKPKPPATPVKKPAVELDENGIPISR
jgi:serine/threonine protein kinase